MKLEEKIYFIRKKEGLSQEEFADKLGVSRQAVYKWESGTTLPEIDKLKIIAKLYNVSFDYLMNDDIDEMDETSTTEVKEPFKSRATYCSTKSLKQNQVDIDNGVTKKRKCKLKSNWLATRQSKTKNHLAALGINNIMYLPHCSATAFFYSNKKHVFGFYYEGEVQFVCPYENIIKFTYTKGLSRLKNENKPVVGLGFSLKGAPSIMGGVVSEQRQIGSTNAIVTITYKTEKQEVKTYTINFDVFTLFGIYIEPQCKDLNELYDLHQVYMARLLNDLSKIEAKIAGFIEIGKDIVAGNVIPENFDYELMNKKNDETRKDYNTFLYLIAEETKKDNIKDAIVLTICFGFLAAVAIFILSFIF